MFEHGRKFKACKHSFAVRRIRTAAPITSGKGALSLINNAHASNYWRFVSAFFFLFFLESSERKHISEEPVFKYRKV